MYCRKCGKYSYNKQFCYDCWCDKIYPPYITKEGYKQIYRPNDPRARDDGYVPEHIHNAQLKYDCYIGNNVVVHHKDGDTLNNNPNNLMIVSKIKHKKIHGYYTKSKKYYKRKYY